MDVYIFFNYFLKFVWIVKNKSISCPNKGGSRLLQLFWSALSIPTITHNCERHCTSKNKVVIGAENSRVRSRNSNHWSPSRTWRKFPQAKQQHLVQLGQKINVNQRKCDADTPHPVRTGQNSSSLWPEYLRQPLHLVYLFCSTWRCLYRSVGGMGSHLFYACGWKKLEFVSGGGFPSVQYGIDVQSAQVWSYLRHLGQMTLFGLQDTLSQTPQLELNILSQPPQEFPGCIYSTFHQTSIGVFMIVWYLLQNLICSQVYTALACSADLNLEWEKWHSPLCR